MGWTARFFRQQRKDQKIAEAVAKRIEEANNPAFTPRPISPVVGTIRYNANKALVEVYIGNGTWNEITNPNLAEHGIALNVMMTIPEQTK